MFGNVRSLDLTWCPDFFYKFCLNLLSGGTHKDRAPAKHSLLRSPCPLPFDRAIPVLFVSLCQGLV